MDLEQAFVGALRSWVGVDPLVETRRGEATEALRLEYARLCKQEFGWELPPKESFNRWLVERKALQSLEGADALLPVLGPAIRAISPSMHHEILEDIPVKLRPPLCFVTSRRKAVDHIYTFRTFALRALDSFRGQSEVLARSRRKELEAIVEDTVRWCKSQQGRGAGVEEIKEKAQAMIDACCPELRRCMSPRVDALCTAMAEAANREALPLRGMPPASEALYVPRIAVAEQGGQGGDMVAVGFEGAGAPLRIQAPFVEKLRALHSLAYTVAGKTVEEETEEQEQLFRVRLWCMLKR